MEANEVALKRVCKLRELQKRLYFMHSGSEAGSITRVSRMRGIKQGRGVTLDRSQASWTAPLNGKSGTALQTGRADKIQVQRSTQ
jgi:hypothetical protein